MDRERKSAGNSVVVRKIAKKNEEKE